MTKEILTDSKVMDLFKGNERALVYYNYDTNNWGRSKYVNFDLPIKEILTFNHEITTNGRLDDSGISYEEASNRLQTANVNPEFTFKRAELY